jgi:hypothetical protein
MKRTLTIACIVCIAGAALAKEAASAPGTHAVRHARRSRLAARNSSAIRRASAHHPLQKSRPVGTSIGPSRALPERQSSQLAPVSKPPVATAQPILAPPPVVSYKDGLLSITAENAELREVMDRVRESTGAAMDVLPVNERVTVHLGPDPPAQVIAALLEGTHVNYVIVGGEAGSERIRAIEFTPETAAVLAPPIPAPPQVYVDTYAAQARARLLGQTGGDEGVWDSVEPGVPVPNPPSPPPPLLPEEVGPAATPAVPPGQN